MRCAVSGAGPGAGAGGAGGMKFIMGSHRTIAAKLSNDWGRPLIHLAERNMDALQHRALHSTRHWTKPNWSIDKDLLRKRLREALTDRGGHDLKRGPLQGHLLPGLHTGERTKPPARRYIACCLRAAALAGVVWRWRSAGRLYGQTSAA